MPPIKRFAVFVAARLQSTRLPGKALLPIMGRPAIAHLFDRVALARLPAFSVLCTTRVKEDTQLARLAEEHGLFVFRGSTRDILRRYLSAADRFGVDFIVTADGDDILCDPNLIDRVCESHLQSGADFIQCKGFPIGTYPYGVSVKALRKVCEIKNERDTEGWGRYFTQTGLFRTEILLPAEEKVARCHARFTLDYEEDYLFLKAVFERLFIPGHVFTVEEVVDCLEREPGLLTINAHCQEEYQRRFALKYSHIAVKPEGKQKP